MGSSTNSILRAEHIQKATIWTVTYTLVSEYKWDQMLPVHSQIDTTISAHQFFIGVWAQHLFAELFITILRTSRMTLLCVT